MSERVRLSLFYAVYFSGLGAFAPYWSLYLDSIGFAALQIGFLTAVVQATRVLGPNLWGHLAERGGRRLQVIRWTSLMAALSFALLFMDHRFAWVLFATIAFSFFWSASLPQVEAVTLDWVRRRAASYGHIRLWGSLGFIVCSFTLGFLIDRFGQWAFLLLNVVLLAGVWLAALGLPAGETPSTPAAGRESVLRLLRRPGVLSFFAACGLEQASHGPYYAFYSLYLQAHGFDGGAIGLMWAFAVLCEVGFFLVSDRIIGYLGLRKVLLGSFVLTAIRWIIISRWPGLGWMVFAQALHAASYGAFHAAAVNLTYQQFPPGLRIRGQALYASLAFGLGGALGGALAGWAWSRGGGAFSYGMAALLAFAGLLLALLATRRLTPVPIQ